MRSLQRNETTVWYCLFERLEEITDGQGRRTGEHRAVYSEPQELRANVSPAAGSAAQEQFGSLDGYDRVITTAWTGCPIDENSVLCIERAPEYTPDNVLDSESGEVLDSAGGEITDSGTRVGGSLIYDYVVKRVVRGLNSVAIAVRKAEVS